MRGKRARLLSWLRAAVLCGSTVVPLELQAQPPDAQPGPATSAAAPGVAPDSPRAALTRFLELCRAGEFAAAVRFFELPAEPSSARSARQDQVRAEQLEGVLDRHARLDLARLSPESLGKLDDGLPADVEEVARVRGQPPTTESVRMIRRENEEPSWVFSNETVDNIEVWHAALEAGWLTQYLPAALLRSGPAQLPYWQWAALPLLFVVAWVGGLFASRICRRLLTKFVEGTRARWDDQVVTLVGGPLTLFWTLGLALFLLPLIGLEPRPHEFVRRLLRAGFYVAFFWALARSVDIGRQVIADSTWGASHPSSRSLVPLAARVAKVVVVAIALVALLSELGYQVGSLVAGLGIGGLAVALAAQKTVENLFGAFSIGADQPIREGDFVRIEDFVGTVEAIGLRSTRVRTLDRTLITIPNGKLAEMRLESFSARDRIRLACQVGLVYATTAEQMRAVLAGLEQCLREHPKIWPDAVVVRLSELGASSLNIEVMAWFLTSDFGEFQSIRQEILLQFMEVVERAGTEFAFPTQTIHLAKPQGQ